MVRSGHTAQYRGVATADTDRLDEMSAARISVLLGFGNTHPKLIQTCLFGITVVRVREFSHRLLRTSPVVSVTLTSVRRFRSRCMDWCSRSPTKPCISTEPRRPVTPLRSCTRRAVGSRCAAPASRSGATRTVLSTAAWCRDTAASKRTSSDRRTATPCNPYQGGH